MDHAALARRLADVVAIPVCPFDADGSVDGGTYAKLVRRLVDGGVGVVTPNGNTGEYYALTPDERRLSVEVTVEAVAGENTEVLVGVGHDLTTAIAEARQARELGASMVMVHQPVHPYISIEGWLDYHTAIARAVPELGVVLYVRDPRIEAEHITRLGDASPNVIGIKHGVPSAMQFGAMARTAGLDRFTWIAGLAEPWAPVCATLGARGFTSGLVNVSPEISLRMRDALRRGDSVAAMEVWDLIKPFEDLRGANASANNVSVVKEALAQLGLCRRDVRAPSSVLSDADRDKVTESLAAWGLVG
jgi:4-hydroxy-tetrahydrodipicolinate synthase